MTEQQSVFTLATGDETGGGYAVVAVKLAPFDSGVQLHSHSRHVEGCYVVEGTLALTCDDRTTTLGPGSSAWIAPDTPHTFWNPSAAPTTLLVVFRPGVSEADALRLAAGAATGSDAG